MVEYGLLGMVFTIFFFFRRKFTPQKSTKRSKILICRWRRGKQFYCLSQHLFVGGRPKMQGRLLWLCGHFQQGNFLQKKEMQEVYLGSKIKRTDGEKNPWRAVKYKTTSVSMLQISGR